MFGHLRGRYPRVSYRTEAPFIASAMVTFGLITWLHHSAYSKLPAGAPDPFVQDLSAPQAQGEEMSEMFIE